MVMVVLGCSALEEKLFMCNYEYNVESKVKYFIYIMHIYRVHAALNSYYECGASSIPEGEEFSGTVQDRYNPSS